jgi:hypothetical protein
LIKVKFVDFRTGASKRVRAEIEQKTRLQPGRVISHMAFSPAPAGSEKRKITLPNAVDKWRLRPIRVAQLCKCSSASEPFFPNARE